MNLCHNCQHARPAKTTGTICAKGRAIAWHAAKGSLDLAYGYRAIRGCSGLFEARVASWYNEHFRRFRKGRK